MNIYDLHKNSRDMNEVVNDLYESNASQFIKMSKKERRQSTLAAKLSLNEAAGDMHDKLYDLEAALTSARGITKKIKYADTHMDVIIELESLAEKVGLKLDEYDVRKVYEANNDLESAVYELEAAFEQAIRDVQNQIDDAEYQESTQSDQVAITEESTKVARSDFEQLKRGTKIKINFGSAFSPGNEEVFTVKSLSRSKKYNLDKASMTIDGKGNFYLRSRDGEDATLALGNMAAIINSYEILRTDESADVPSSTTPYYAYIAAQQAWLKDNPGKSAEDFVRAGLAVQQKYTAPEMSKRGYKNESVQEVAGPDKCWDGYKKDGTQAGTGKNKGKRVNKCKKEAVDLEESYDDDDAFFEAYGWIDLESLEEAEYQGRKVKLGKPMQGDVKKFKVYVKDPKTGNVKKVNFGHGGSSVKGKAMKIRKSNPKARKSFRARHNCDNPGPRTKARYWSCRKW